MKALVGALNQEEALVGVVVIVKIDCETDGSFYSTSPDLCKSMSSLLRARSEVSPVTR